MSKETFMLVSLKENKAKKLAQVISNPTCRKILDYLSQKEATESEIAKNLEIPISTVHYNLVHLKESKLVEVEEFHYSEKGKEVSHYKLANKYIIIAPKETSPLLDKLKTLLPVTLILGAGISIWQFSQGMFGKTARIFSAGAAESADVATATLSTATIEAAKPVWPLFVYGAIAAISLYLFIDWLRGKFR